MHPSSTAPVVSGVVVVGFESVVDVTKREIPETPPSDER